jgi:hypothetical protein
MVVLKYYEFDPVMTTGFSKRLDYRHTRHEVSGAYILVAHAPIFTSSTTTKAVPSTSATTSSPSA